MDDFVVKDSNIIYVSQFGSYGTEEWIKNISDIDIGIIVKSLEELDFDLESRVIEYFRNIYNYNDVNVTIVEYDLDNKLTRNIICGKTLYSTIDEKHEKYNCLNIERCVQRQREYYEFYKLQKLRNEVADLW